MSTSIYILQHCACCDTPSRDLIWKRTGCAEKGMRRLSHQAGLSVALKEGRLEMEAGYT